MRVDVNISIRPNTDAPLGTRVELKNINSFGAVRRAIEAEYARQVALYEAGESFEQQTRGRDDAKGESYLMRKKSDNLDYRYFPEPDLPSLAIDAELQVRIDKQAVEIPYMLIKRYKDDYGFHKEFINALIGDKDVLDYFNLCVSDGFDPKTLVKRIAGPIAAYTKEHLTTIQSLPFDRDDFLQFIAVATEGKIKENQLKIVMEEMLATGKEASIIIEEKQFNAPGLSDDELQTIVQTVLDTNPAIVEQYKAGKTTTIGFFVGQVMKQTQGKANPQQIQDIISKILA